MTYIKIKCQMCLQFTWTKEKCHVPPWEVNLSLENEKAMEDYPWPVY